METRINRQILEKENQLTHAGKLLEKQLAKASQIRNRALKDENDQLFKQAEFIELQALAQYERAVKQFVLFSKQLDMTTKAHALSTAKAHSVSQANGNTARNLSSASLLRPNYRLNRQIGEEVRNADNENTKVNVWEHFFKRNK